MGFLYSKPVPSSLITLEIGSNMSTFFYMWTIHLVINFIGIGMVKSELARFGHEQVLDNFKEGVILVEPDQNEVLFANHSARKLRIHMNLEQFSFGQDLSEAPDLKVSRLDSFKLMLVNKNIFNQTVDSLEITRHFTEKKPTITLEDIAKDTSAFGDRRLFLFKGR